MQIDKDDSRGEDQMASTSIVDKRKTILIQNSDSADDNHVAPIDTLMEGDDAPVSWLAGIYAAVRTLGIDYLKPLLCLLRHPCM